MRTAADFGDPQAETKLRVDALLAADLGEGRPYLAGVDVGTELPRTAPLGRLLIVRSGVWTQYEPPAAATNLVRVVAWAPYADDAWSIASWCHARLLAAPGDALVRSYGYSEGPRHGKDPDYDTPICAFTVLARMKPRLL